MPDFYALGLTYNDTVGNKNFFLLNNESNADLVKTVGFQEGVNRGEWVSVDNDHVTYANRMQPMLTKCNANVCIKKRAFKPSQKQFRHL